MYKISSFQLYSLLVLLVVPVAVLEQPHILLHIVANNAWLTILAALPPGILLILMYSYIINKSTQPFPRLLDEHIGKIAGRILGFVYIPIFFLSSGYNLRLFIEFMKMNVLPATPISIFIGVLTVVGFLAIKIGLENIARVGEIITPVGISFTFVIIVIALFTDFQPARLLPVAYISYKDFFKGVLLPSTILGKMMPVLTLAFFLQQKEKARATMIKVLFTYISMLTIICLTLVITIGTLPCLNYVFPTFNMIRLARIGIFVQNIDIAFITIWVMGIFASVTIPWFMSCFIIKDIFNLQDYRFLAAPSTLIISILSIAISPNSLDVVFWNMRIIPLIYFAAFIFLPFIIFIITLFKPYPDCQLANTGNHLNKQIVTGKN